ncbi:hypothetical protein ACAW74_18200 [Fibrella sp. WM1]|uniref:hypothetical protein n=1 Tax=Fibrella musci TaxID=3242485 RepID=UPI0035224C39
MTTNETVDKLGIGNPILNFGSETVHFGSKYDAGRTFSFQIINTATAVSGDNGVRQARIFAGLDQLVGAGTVPGLVKDGTFSDKNAATGLSALSLEGKSILSLQKYLSITPTLLRGMHVQFSDPTQAGNAFKFVYDDPFGVKTDRILRPSTAYNQNTQNTNYLLLPNIDEIITGQNSLDYTISPSVTVTITMYFGASIDLSKALANYKLAADAQISLVGAAAIERMDTIALAGGATR